MSALLTSLEIIGTIASLVALTHSAWWALLAAFALRRPRRRTAARRHMFATIVPAHNEEKLIADCVESLVRASGDQQVRVLVVADNCSDSTAARAREAGAEVVERQDSSNFGKSYALDFGLEHLRQDPPEFVAFVDGDSVVEDGFFDSLAARFESGEQVVQGCYGVVSEDSSLIRLRALAFALVHYARPLGASRLGLGTSLKGNGMAMTWAIAEPGIPAGGITEDAAMSIEYARVGVPIVFEPAARVRGRMAATYEGARTQDLRWESGRLQLSWQAWRQALGCVRRRQFAATHSCAEVGSLPFSLVVMLGLLGAALATLGAVKPPLASLPFLLLAFYVSAGWYAAGVRWRDLSCLAAVPRFALHKARVWTQLVRSGPPGSWERTPR